MLSPTLRRQLWTLGAALTAGCGGASPPGSSRPVLQGVEVMPHSVPTASATGRDAVEAVFRVGETADSVATWYRRWFLTNGWDMVGDARMPDGSLTLHAERGGRPLWVLIQPDAGRPGTTYSIFGAQPDSGGARAPAR